MKPIVVGLVAGVLACAVFSRVGDRRHSADRQELAEQLAKAEERAALSEREALEAQQQLVRVREERVPPRDNPSIEAPPPPEPPRPRSMKSLAAEVARLAPRLRGCAWACWPREARGLQSRILEEMNRLAHELGISTQEAMRSPDGLALLIAETVDPEAQTWVRDLLAAEKPAWDAWREARKDLSCLESRRVFLDLAGRTREVLLSALTEPQRDQALNLGVLDEQIQGSQTWLDGPRATVTRQLATQWSSTLNLDAHQARIVDPIVHDYIRLSRELNESIWARRRAGEDLSRERDYAMRLDLMIQTHRRIVEAAGLNEDQMQAMKDWQFTYGVNFTD